MTAANTDREMLELAAKAFGGRLWTDAWGNTNFVAKDGTARLWRPHKDDGDSRRLQVTLGIGLTIDGERATAYINSDGEANHPSEPLGDDPAAAARLAVLRAAAEIGRAMP